MTRPVYLLSKDAHWLIGPGPAAHVRLSPDPVRVSSGGSRRVCAFDALARAKRDLLRSAR